MYKNNIKLYRKEKNITLSQLSKLTGVSIGYLCHLENGSRKNPSTHILEKVSEALNKSVQDIFFN